MKIILKIFKQDLQGLLKNFLALVVAVGLCLLPALYAWFNIYANWDPYSNTGNIKIAVANLDEGEMGENIVASLKEKDSICWVFLDTEEEAENGVKAGDYYAALVIESDFTYGMYHGIAENVSNPKIIYYVNDKKNAVATKITDSAVSAVKASINKQFVQVLAEKVFTETNGVSEEIKDKDSVNQFIGKLEAVSKSLTKYDHMISTFISGNESLAALTVEGQEDLIKGQSQMNQGIKDLEDAKGSLSKTKVSFNDFSNEVDTTLTQITTSLDTISTSLKEAQLDKDVEKIENDVKAIQKDIEDLTVAVEKLYNLVNAAGSGIPENDKVSITALLTSIKEMEKSISKMLDGVKAAETTKATIDSLTTSLDSYSRSVDQIHKMYNKQIVPQVNSLLDSLEVTLTSVQKLLTSLGTSTEGMKEVFTNVSTTIDTLNTSLVELQDILENSKEKIDSVLTRLEDASEQEQVEILLNFLSGDPEALGTFFSEPVQVENNYIYEIKNYGSGVAPFYTTLAIWVGMTILVSLIKVHAKPFENLKCTPAQLYFGRYLTFLLLSQIQTLIIVIGDLFILGVQCVHPFAFWCAAAMTSFTFSLLVYSLTIAFGDIGKALAVVIMVIQIAGSGGTYPIEALPDFFRAVYIFFPFPYAIDAMRECVGGMYEADFLICLARLALFCVAALVIGLVVRIPFIHINHYIEERMEDTHLM